MNEIKFIYEFKKKQYFRMKKKKIHILNEESFLLDEFQ